MRLNGVKSGKAEMPILSQAVGGRSSTEGAETTVVSPNNNPLHERPALDETYRRSYDPCMPKGRFWSDSDQQWLINHYELRGLKGCAEDLNRSEAAIMHMAKRLGLARRGSIRGSRVLLVDGYIWISESGRNYALHRRMMEQELGRGLTPEEIVHHKDGNTFNNDPSNLVLTTRTEHMRLHPKVRDELGRFRQDDDIVRPNGKETVRSET